MVKTLATLAVIIVAVTMAWGINTVAKKRQAASTESTSMQNQNSSTPIPSIINSAPSNIRLEILSPAQGSIVTDPTLTIEGKSSAQAEININDLSLKSDETGMFSGKITLDEGENEITLVANDSSGESVETVLKITYAPIE